MARRRDWGQIDNLPSGNFRARYTGPDGRRHNAPTTFTSKTDAGQWLAAERTLMASGQWAPPEERAARTAAESRLLAEKQVTLKKYAEDWIATRTNSKGLPLRPRTREGYEDLLARPLADLADTPLPEISPTKVRSWRAAQIATGKVTQTSRAYALLKSIMSTAVVDGIVSSNPCVIRGGGQASTGKAVVPPTDAELQTILDTITPKYEAMVLLAAIGGLRYGEIIALTAQDIGIQHDGEGNVEAVRVQVNKQVVWLKKQGAVVGEVKALASNREISIFHEDAQVIAAHVRPLLGKAVLFPSADGRKYLRPSTFAKHWYPARKEAGRTDLPFHGLRHYAGTAFARTGATVAETMARLGHSSTQASMRYQHAEGREDELAARLHRRKTS